MVIGFGPGANMLKDFKNNRAKLGVHKKEKEVETSSYKNSPIREVKADPEYIEQIRENKKHQLRNQTLVFTIIFCIVLLIFILI